MNKFIILATHSQLLTDLKINAVLLAAILFSSTYLFSPISEFAILDSTHTQIFQNTTAVSKASKAFQNATKYEVVKVWGSKGTKDGQFQRPHDLDFSNDEKYL